MSTFNNKLPIAIAFIQGLFELVGVGGFLVGYFADIWWLMMLGGCLVVLDDVIEVRMDILNPLFPALLAIVLASLFTPWYVGVFWASAAFKMLSIPISLIKVFTPRRFAMRTLHAADGTKLVRRKATPTRANNSQDWWSFEQEDDRIAAFLSSREQLLKESLPTMENQSVDDYLRAFLDIRTSQYAEDLQRCKSQEENEVVIGFWRSYFIELCGHNPNP